jgi:hypothetical protein
MATKVKKSYGPTDRKKGSESDSKTNDKNEKLAKRELPIHPNGTVLPAPLWRRAVSYLIDATLGLGTSMLMLNAASAPQTEMGMKLWLLISAFIFNLWIYGFLPGEFTVGQTPGQKLLRLYVRQVNNKKTLGIWRSMVRGYFYGLIGAPMTIPFELFHLCIQYVMGKKGEHKTLQNLPISQKALVLPRDLLFKAEVIYVPKA